MKPAAKWGLTPAETKIMDLMVLVGSQKLIARRLGRAVKTVNTHVDNIRNKAEADSSMLMAVEWSRYRRVHPADERPLTGGELDTLVALVEQGPLWDGDVPSKAGRDDLIGLGLAVRVLVGGEDGHTAATYRGCDAYKKHFGSTLGGDADTVAEAKANRLARVAIRSANRGETA